MPPVEHDLHPHAHHAGGADDVEHVHFHEIALFGVPVDFGHTEICLGVLLVFDTGEPTNHHRVKVHPQRNHICHPLPINQHMRHNIIDIPFLYLLIVDRILQRLIVLPLFLAQKLHLFILMIKGKNRCCAQFLFLAFCQRGGFKMTRLAACVVFHEVEVTDNLSKDELSAQEHVSQFEDDEKRFSKSSNFNEQLLQAVPFRFDGQLRII